MAYPEFRKEIIKATICTLEIECRCITDKQKRLVLKELSAKILSMRRTAKRKQRKKLKVK